MQVYMSAIFFTAFLISCQTTEQISSVKVDFDIFEDTMSSVFKKYDEKGITRDLRLSRMKLAYVKPPLDPWGNEYIYLFSEGILAMYSKGMDGEINTEDDHVRIVEIK